MDHMVIAVGTKETMVEDIHVLARQWVENPEIVTTAGKDTKNTVMQMASALFVQDNVVLVLVDPEISLIEEIKTQLHSLKKTIHIIVYTTSPADELEGILGVKAVILEKDKGARIKTRVLAVLRRHGKVMTDKGFALLTDRIRDESILEPELAKLVNYAGEKRKIDSRDVQAVVTETHEENLVALFDALATMDRKEILAVFENLLLNGVHVLAIHSYLVRQVRLLLQAKDMEEVFKASPEYNQFVKAVAKWKESLDPRPGEKKHYLPHQKPFYAHKLAKISERIPRGTLISLFDTLASFDGVVKRGTKFERFILECGLVGTI
jgi:DNA polymerase III delta subunit